MTRRLRDLERPNRRRFLGASLGASAAALIERPARPAAATPTVVDIHCHVFNGSDLPVTGFVAHFIPGLVEISRVLTSVPELIVRTVVGFLHKQGIDRVAPTAAQELAFLNSANKANRPIAPVIFPTKDATYQQLLDEAAKQLGAVPLLRLDRDTIDRVIQLLFLVTHERARIAATMTTTYKEVDLFTPLLVDYDAWTKDKPATPLVDQIDVHGAVSRASTRGLVGRANARIHPFVAFDPMREVNARMSAGGPYKPYGDARVFTKGTKYQGAAPGAAPPPRPAAGAGGLEPVRYAVEKVGFIGCKVYPPVGFAPLDNERLDDSAATGRQLDLALRAFYAYCEAEEVPITAHTSSGNEFGLGFRTFASPARWELALREFPRLHLNLGHFGHEEGVDSVAGVEAAGAWIRQAAALMSVYPNVYADLSNSALVYDEAYATRYLGHLEAIFKRFPNVPRRIMYGSDFWLNRLAAGSDIFVTQFNAKLGKKFGDVVRADIMGTNALRFLGFAGDATARRNRARLRSFYGAQPLPSWLTAG
jgi:predicted TIM-barrel fold metal-dependent hydrolase